MECARVKYINNKKKGDSSVIAILLRKSQRIDDRVDYIILNNLSIYLSI